MSIVIDYTLAPHGPGVAVERLAEADATTLRYDCFAGDVILIVGGVDLSARWGWIPLLDFAMALDDLVDALASGDGVEVFEFTESEATLRVERSDDEVFVRASWVTGSAVTRYADLRAAAKTVLGRLLADLTSRYPPLTRNAMLVERFGRLTDL